MTDPVLVFMAIGPIVVSSWGLMEGYTMAGYGDDRDYWGFLGAGLLMLGPAYLWAAWAGGH